MGVPKLCDFLSAKRLASGLDFLLPFDSIQGMSGYSNVPIAAHTQQAMSSRRWIALAKPHTELLVA